MNLILLVLVQIASTIAKNLTSKVTSFPGIDSSLMLSDWYSGYYPVSNSKHLHYLFIESLNEPSTDPVIIFFNGGPGSASIHLAFFGLSPLRASNNENGTFTLVPFNQSWCTNASLLLIDNPAGVGFSYAPKNWDNVHNDDSY